MGIREVLESEQASMAILRRLRQLHGTDAATLVLLAEAMEEAAGRLVKLNDLYHYKDTNGDKDADKIGDDN